MYFVYLLVSEKTLVPIYAGHGKKARVLQHLSPCFQRQWGEPAVHSCVVTCETKVQALELERKWIKKYDPPFNRARWGTHGGIKHTTEARKRISDSLSYTLKDPDERLKKAARLGMKNRLEHNRKISEGIALWRQKRKLAEALLGA